MKKILSIIIIGILIGCSFAVQELSFEKPIEKTTLSSFLEKDFVLYLILL